MDGILFAVHITTMDGTDLLPYIPDVRKWVARKVPLDDRDDVVQGVFVCAHRNIKTFNANSTLKTWLFAITRRHIADYYRAKKRYSERFGDHRQMESAYNPWTKINQRLYIDQLVDDLLPPKSSDALREFMMGMSLAESAEEHHIEYEAARSRYWRAIRRARRILEKTVMVLVSLLVLASVAYSHPTVNPDMIEISYDGVTFADASAVVSDIVISIGTVPVVHPPGTTIYVGRGVTMGWAAQLGTPYTQQRVDWKLNTALIPADKTKFRVRVRFAVGSAVSPYSDPSEEITLIDVGKPSKPTVIIF